MRDLADIKADLAHCDRDGTPWPAAARRLLSDIEPLVSALEAVEALAERTQRLNTDTAWNMGARQTAQNVLGTIRSTLAAAADAPQPARPSVPPPEPGVRACCGDTHLGDGCDPDAAGPSPAGLPDNREPFSDPLSIFKYGSEL